jgi:hypothetical protein
VAKGSTAGAGNPNSRQFYTNAAKDDNQSAMTMLHDHIVSRYPGVCPMEAQMPGTEIDSDGQAGTAAEMQAKGPGMETLPTPPGAADAGTLRPVGKKKSGKTDTKTEVAQVGKAVGTTAIDVEAVKELVQEGLRKERKATKREVARLTKGLKRTKRSLAKRSEELHKALAQKQFTPRLTADPEKVLEAKAATERIRTLKMRTGDGNSQVAQSAVEALMNELSPQEFAKVMAADAE